MAMSCSGQLMFHYKHLIIRLFKTTSSTKEILNINKNDMEATHFQIQNTKSHYCMVRAPERWEGKNE